MSSNATESTRALELLSWVLVNWKKLVAGAAVIGVVAGVLALYRWKENAAEAKANAALIAVQLPAGQTQGSPGLNAQAYLQVASAHAGTGAGARALLFGAEALFRDGNYEEAKAQFEKFLRECSDNPETPAAAFGAAACLEAMDKTNEALAAYQDVISRHGNSAVAGRAKLSLARLYESRNEPAQALRIYQELTRPTAQSAWTSEAVMRREALLQQHPELIATNSPVSAATDPPSQPDGGFLQLTPTGPPSAATPNPQ